MSVLDAYVWQGARHHQLPRIGRMQFENWTKPKRRCLECLQCLVNAGAEISRKHAMLISGDASSCCNGIYLRDHSADSQLRVYKLWYSSCADSMDSEIEDDFSRALVT